MQPTDFLLALGAIAYLLVLVSLIRLQRWWLDRRDAQRLAEFKAQCLLAEAEALRAGRARAQERAWGRAA